MEIVDLPEGSHIYPMQYYVVVKYPRILNSLVHPGFVNGLSGIKHLYLGWPKPLTDWNHQGCQS